MESERVQEMSKILFCSLSDFEIENLLQINLKELTIAAIVQFHEAVGSEKRLNCEFISTETLIRQAQSRKFELFDLTEIPPDYLTSTYREQIIALEMMLRIDTTKDMRLLDRRDIFFFISAFWLKKLKSLKPSAIYFGVMPHEVGDYILYIVARYLGIDTLINIESYVLGRRRICNSVEFPQESHPGIEYKKFQESGINLEDWLIEQGNIKVKQYANWMIHIDELKSNKYENLLFLRFLKRSLVYFSGMSSRPRINLIDKSKITTTNLSITEKLFGNLIYSIKKFISLEIINFERRLIALDRSQRFEDNAFNGDFVVLFLHYQPEMLVSPTAGDFFDQIQNIAFIAANLPRGWKLLVKEHPAQEKDSYGYNYLGREPLFYSKLSSIENVHLVRTGIRSHELIQKSRGVATISGTVGWQALALFKPVLFFGNVWYGNAPYTHRAISTDSINNFMQDCKVTNIPNSRKTYELLEYLNKYVASSFEMQTNEVSSRELGIKWDAEFNRNNWNIMLEQIIKYYPT